MSDMVVFLVFAGVVAGRIDRIMAPRDAAPAPAPPQEEHQ